MMSRSALILVVLAVLLFGISTPLLHADEPASAPKLKILVCGAHPDDPESGVGGTISRLTAAGHEVTVVYAVTFRTGRTYFERPEKEVRQEEAAAACAILNAKPLFLEYAAGEFYADQPTLEKFTKLLAEQKPDIVLTHWPVDTHPDHEVISTLVWRNYQRQGGWNLYYFEVNAGHQTLAYTPNQYIDIGPVKDQKFQALMRHTSQKPDTIWADHHAPMQLRRGQECGVEHAEALLLVEPKPGCPLLPLEVLSQKAGK
ncbi:MAG: PIG-L deacetylase family protein [Planctomycetaceae bacterium]